ncbi:hypothetical protein STCU_02904 [Strigomonas culicis]|uniref:PEP5/VPS11 N-terminal domain-containing protein n=1 Tax=Strigomonas culicis TaxID=28005 RepID=S9UN20_9TRYP|nr:hypothetical protein STCU_02904 [Strigomonas culicis]|eukprot:EPY32252.1 hypothetical protein STCU_02904 [Strigomonas culicis]
MRTVARSRGVEMTCCCRSPQYLFAGDAEGLLFILDRRDHTPVLVFQAYATCTTHMVYVPSAGVLATLGHDNDGAPCAALLRLWTVEQVVALQRGAAEGPLWRPPCKTHSLFSASRPVPPLDRMVPLPSLLLHPDRVAARQLHAGRSGAAAAFPRTAVVSFDLTADLSQAVFALATGECVVLRGALAEGGKTKLTLLKSRLAKGPLVFVGFPPRHAVRCGAAAQPPQQTLYTVYEDAVTVWSCAAGYTEYACAVQSGGSVNCVALGADGELAVASATSPIVALLGPPAAAEAQEAVYNPTQAASVRYVDMECLPIRKLLVHRGYVVLLTQQEEKQDQFVLQAYDAHNYIRGFSRVQEPQQHCAFLLADSSDVLLLSHAAATAPTAEPTPLRTCQLSEISTQLKLDLLFVKECYGVAKAIARGLPNAEPTLLLHIQKVYGDFLYSKGKFAEAMDEYVDTIGFLEPSYVIRKYLHGQHMGLLTLYLEELHRKRDAKSCSTINHTTLLLSTYIKQKEEDKLMHFIHRDDVRFDPTNVIAVCRQGGYFAAALYVADRYAQVRDYVRIVLRDLHDAPRALAAVRRLRVDEAEDACRALGRELLRAEPRLTTELLVDLCVHWKGPKRRMAAEGAPDAPQPPPDRASVTSFVHMFVHSPRCLFHFLRAVVASGALDVDEAEPTSLEPAERAQARSVFNALFELYITKELKMDIAREETDEDDHAASCFPREPYEDRRRQAMTFLEAYSGRYDDYVVLTLCHQHHFEEGYLFLLKKTSLTEELIDFYFSKYAVEGAETQEERSKLLRACKRTDLQSDQSRTVWLSLLRHMVRCPSVEGRDLENVLSYIEEHGILSPVVVLELLGQCTDTTLSLRSVRRYCQTVLEKKQSRLQASQSLLEGQLQRARQLQGEMVALQTSAVVFSPSQCAHCGQALDLPTVHFLCRHSFHQRCLHVATECNLCAPRHQQAAEEQRALTAARGAPAAFFEELEKAMREGGGADGLAVCARFVGMGALESSAPVSGRDAEGKAREFSLW